MSTLIRDLTKSHKTKYFCRKCLTRINDINQVGKHVKICRSPTDINTEFILSKPGSVVKFRNIHKQFKHPYIVYADFECLLIKEPNVTTK
jgi:hypothetical protein